MSKKFFKWSEGYNFDKEKIITHLEEPYIDDEGNMYKLDGLAPYGFWGKAV